jgi:RNA polymerase sigma factor (sigma-70 family)
MELTTLIHRARAADLDAFTELTRRYQNLAFGYAFSLLGDFHLAQDAVQEAFIAAYFGLAQLAEPAAFPGWLRGIVRHQCYRILRKHPFELVPLEHAAEIAAETGEPERHLVQQETRDAVLAAINALPRAQREVVTLYYLQEYSQQEVAGFLGLPVSTVNNRLHAARQRLTRRMLQMAAEYGPIKRREALKLLTATPVLATALQDAFKEQGLPDDFAARIGKLLQVRGPVVDAQFDPNDLPEVLSALTISDEPGQIDVTVEVIQRLPNGVVRCIARAPIQGLRGGMKVVRTGEPARVPVDDQTLERAVTILSAPAGEPQTGAGTAAGAEAGELLETGIKVIDLLCPYRRGGRVGIFGDMRVGKLVLIEELVRGMATRHEGASLFTFVSTEEVPAIQETRAKEPGWTGGTVGAAQTFYILSERPTDPEHAAALTFFDAVTYLSREIGAAGIWPAVDPLASTSRLLDPTVVGQEHWDVAQRARQLLQRARTLESAHPAGEGLSDADRRDLSCARKLRRFFSQPFVVAEPFTGLPGRSVSRDETVRACRAILDGMYDAVPEGAFTFVGGIEEVVW